MIKFSLIFIAFLIYIEQDTVLTLNIELARAEENILYSYLKNQNNFKLLYDKLIESNGVDDLSYIRQKITNEDIQQGTIENKVNIFENELNDICVHIC